MNSQDVEREILEILETEKCAATLSQKIFSQEGLFAKLAETREERQALVRSALYQRAQKRFRELQHHDMETFQSQIAELRAASVESSSVVKLEQVHSR